MSERIENACLFEINGHEYYCGYYKLSEVYHIIVSQRGNLSNGPEFIYRSVNYHNKEYNMFSSVISSKEEIEEDLGTIKEEDAEGSIYPSKFQFKSLTLGYYTSPSDNSEGLKPAM